MIEGRCLPEEDSINFRLGAMPCLWLGAVCAVDDFPDRESRPDVVDVVVIDLPHISNITDIDALRAESGVRVRVVRRLEDIGRPHVALLLGSKNVIVDLRHLYASGLAGALLRLAYDDAGEGYGCTVVGICGGLQMMGLDIADPLGLESGGRTGALGLLPLNTRLERQSSCAGSGELLRKAWRKEAPVWRVTKSTTE